MEAVQLYQRVVERVPNDADAWFRLANTYAQQGAYERAIHAYETSLFNNSQQPKAGLTYRRRIYSMRSQRCANLMIVCAAMIRREQ